MGMLRHLRKKTCSESSGNKPSWGSGARELAVQTGPCARGVVSLV